MEEGDEGVARPRPPRLVTRGVDRGAGREEGTTPLPAEQVGPYCLRIFWARMRLRMRFLRHFQRMWPRFFQTRELRFIQGASEDGRGVQAAVY